MQDPVAATHSVRSVSGLDAGASAASQLAPSYTQWAADRPPAREQECEEPGEYRDALQERILQEAEAKASNTVTKRNVKHLEIMKCTHMVTGDARENKEKVRKLEELTNAQYNACCWLGKEGWLCQLLLAGK